MADTKYNQKSPKSNDEWPDRAQIIARARSSAANKAALSRQLDEYLKQTERKEAGK
jgi:hypothetical protein